MKASRNKQLDYLLVNMLQPPHHPSVAESLKYQEENSNHKIPFTLKQIDEYYNYGPGVSLYFGLLRYLMACFIILILISLPSIISNSNGDGLAIYNEGDIGIMRYSLANQKFFEYPQSLNDAWSQTEIDRLEDIQSTQLFLIINDVVISLVFAAFLIGWGVKAHKILKKSTGQLSKYHYKRYRQEGFEEEKELQALPSYYSLKLRNIQSLALKPSGCQKEEPIRPSNGKKQYSLSEAEDEGEVRQRQTLKMKRDDDKAESETMLKEEETKRKIFELMKSIIVGAQRSSSEVNELPEQISSGQKGALTSRALLKGLECCKIELVYDYKDCLYALDKFLGLIEEYGECISEQEKILLYNEIQKSYYNIKRMYASSTSKNVDKFHQPFIPVKAFVTFDSIEVREEFFKQYRKWRLLNREKRGAAEQTAKNYLSQKLEDLDLEELMSVSSEEVRVVKCDVEPSNIMWENYHVNDLMDFSKRVKIYCCLAWLLLAVLVAIFLINVGMAGLISNPVSFDEYKNTPEYQANPTPSYSQAVESGDQVVVYIFCSQLTHRTFQWEYYELCQDYFTNFEQRTLDMAVLSCIVFAINFGLNKLIHLLAERRRYRTWTDKQRFLIVTIFVVVLVNSGLLVLLIRAEFSDVEDSPNRSDADSISLLALSRSLFGDGFLENKQVELYEEFNRKWYVHIGQQLMLNFLVSLILAPWLLLLIRVARSKYDARAAQACLTQKAMNQKSLLQKFDFQTLYAILIVAVWFTFSYGCGMPVFYILCLLSVSGIFVSSKLMFKYYSRKPVPFDHTLNTKVSKILMASLILHQLFSIGFLFAEDIFADRQEIYKNTQSYNKSERILIFALMIAVLILLTIYYQSFVRLIIDKLGRRNLGNSSVLSSSAQRKQEQIRELQEQNKSNKHENKHKDDGRLSEDGLSREVQNEERLPYHSEHRKTHQAQKIGYLRSYRMSDNPAYEHIGYTLMILNMTINEHQSIEQITQNELIFDRHHEGVKEGDTSLSQEMGKKSMKRQHDQMKDDKDEGESASVNDRSRSGIDRSVNRTLFGENSRAASQFENRNREKIERSIERSLIDDEGEQPNLPKSNLHAQTLGVQKLNSSEPPEPLNSELLSEQQPSEQLGSHLLEEKNPNNE